ncbi:SCP2 domain-containing protein [Nitrosomonas sp. Nm166]|uniref:ubiquinone biosynthesis accessory factor UbiJ n=1 Tax=Nitrosomonas sp. Nm166 TaxID=1881054 RepID=UPI0008E0E0DA|nr:hypothetical protein [Nitrosomonas sp. Nm166]SFE07007.1 ubiquinone biosynthesis protein UbiJ [Nitrosomonas sp. Nm166]
MLTFGIAAPINYVLRSEGWACKRLQSFSGQTVCIQIPPLVNFKMLIDAEGEVQQVDNSICADTALTLSPFTLARIFARESVAFKLIKVSGNRFFASELINISKQINFNMILEHDLSKVIGDIPAYRISHIGKHLIQWKIENFNRLSKALVEYWTEENIFLTKPTAINQFSQEVKNLQLNTEQLEQRLNRLTQQSA